MSTCGRKNCWRTAYRQGLCHAHYDLIPHGYVESAPIVARYQLLRERGLTVEEIARQSGVHRDTLRLIGTHGCGGARRETLERVMAVRVPPRVVPSRVEIPAVGTRRRIQALAVIGWSLGLTGEAMGVTQQAVTALLRNTVVQASTAAKVHDLFDARQMVDGPSMRARRCALARGWLPPLAWDDPDDPDEQPVLHSRPVRFVDLYEDMRAIRLSQVQMVEKLGCTPAAFARRLDRYGIPVDSVLRGLVWESRGRAA